VNESEVAIDKPLDNFLVKIGEASNSIKTE
jgi:hypothetical protein